MHACSCIVLNVFLSTVMMFITCMTLHVLISTLRTLSTLVLKIKTQYKTTNTSTCNFEQEVLKYFAYLLYLSTSTDVLEPMS